MSVKTTKYTNYSIHQMFISSLAEDGAICQATAKEYDERGTQKGGTGPRRSFTHYNNRVNLYQTALKVIKGEHRANIYEAIPVIDYATPENTGLENIYETTEDGSVDSRYITRIPLDVEDTALSLLLADDPYTINRALLGQETAEHFYNTRGLTGSEYNLQTDPVLISKYLYTGVRSKTYSTTEQSITTAYRKASIYATQDTLESKVTLHVNPLDELIGTSSPDGFYYDDYNRNNTRNVKVILPEAIGGSYDRYTIYRDEIRDTDLRKFVVKSSSDSNYIDILLESGDICIQIPGASTSTNREKLLILKLAIEGTPEDYVQTYIPFIVYYSDYSPISLTEIAPEGDLPDYLKSQSVLDQLCKYIGVEKIYTSKASGLLNGLFCEPYKFEEGYEDRVVTEWKYKDETGDARGVVIKPGTRYFSGHLLGRGSFLAGPLKRTAHDPKIDDNDIPYKGKATLIYDRLNSEDTRLSLLRPSMLEDWSGAQNTITLTGLYTKASYASEKLSAEDRKDLVGTLDTNNSILKNSLNSKYTEKLTIDGRPADLAEISTVISGLSEMLEPVEDGLDLYIDLTSAALDKSPVCYYQSIKNEAYTKHLFGLVKKDASSTVMVYDNTNLMYSNIHKFVSVSYRTDYNQDGSLKNRFATCMVDVLNPLRIFKENFNSTSTTILLYPEYNKYYPTELLLMSTSNLGLEVYDDSPITYKKKNMISFFYEPEGKIVAFKVGRIRVLELSKINDIYIQTVDSGKFEKVNATRSWDKTTANDCYIYTLEPLELSLAGVEIRGQNDEIVSLKNVASVDSTNLQLIPASYPSNYFPVTTQYKSDGTPTYIISADHRSSDLQRLAASRIIIGLPYVDSLSELRTTSEISDPGLRDALANLFDSPSDKDGVGNRMATFLARALQSVLSSWRLTDETTGNPILLKDFPQVLKGLIEFEGPLRQFSQIRVLEEEGSTSEVIKDDEGNIFDPEELRDFLKDRFESNNQGYVYEISVPPLDTSKWLPIDKETIDPECTNLPGIIKQRLLQSIALEIQKTDTPKKNVSIKQGYALFKNLQEPHVTIDRETCLNIDEYFGDNTTPFLRFIDGMGVETVFNVLGDAVSEIRENIKSVILKTTQNYVEFLNEPILTGIREQIKDLYKRYYKESSITFSEDSIDVNEEELLFNFNADSGNLPNIRTFLSSAINEYGLTKKEDYTKNHKFLWWGWTTTHTRTVSLTTDDAIKNFELDGSGPVKDVDSSAITSLNNSQQSTRKNLINYIYNQIIATLKNPLTTTKAAAPARYLFPTEEQVEEYLTGVIKGLEPAEFYTGLLYKGTGTITNPETRETLKIEEAFCKVIKNPRSFKWYRSLTVVDFYEGELPEDWENPDPEALVVYEKRDGFDDGTGVKKSIYTQFTFANKVEDFKYSTEKINNTLGNAIFAVPAFSEDSRPSSGETMDLVLTIVLPDYKPSLSKNAEGKIIGKFLPRYQTDLENSIDATVDAQDTDNKYCSIPFQMDSSIIDYDLSEGTLKSIVNFAEKSLFGVDTTTGEETSTYPVRFVEGDSAVTGRETSLYFKRYQMLNNRMNRLQGPLARAASFLRHKDIFTASQKFSEDMIDSYSPFLTVLPISSVEPLTLMKAQKASTTTIELNSKFYSTKELDALRAQISSQCVLTCTRCSVKDSCPFYDENEITKLYCTPTETLDLWVKDNELDLLYYSKEDLEKGLTESPNVYAYTEEGEKIHSITVEDSKEFYSGLKDYHKPYSEILAKHISSSKQERYSVRNLRALKEEIQKQPYAEEEFVKNLGWLTGARYGTIEGNGVRDFENEEYDSSAISKYRYLFDALYIPDEETHVVYAPSSKEYPVSFYKQENGRRVHYKGTTKIKVPVGLDVFLNADATDDVYLVSDDRVDDEGNAITPIIYLDKVGGLRWTFNFEESSDLNIKDANDPKTYAADVAQWCINYYKGACLEEPIGDNAIKDYYLDRDQYWMETIYKKLPAGESDNTVDSYIAVPGRPREAANYQEPLMEIGEFNETEAISGKPVVANYINFIRKVSIRMYDREKEQWCFKWIKDATSNDKQKIEERKAALPFMKTNLRLVVVKNYDSI